MSRHSLKIIPLGGLGEIGKNMMAVEYDSDIVVIDAGVLFPQEDMIGVDLVIPNIAYLIENRHRVRGILITHGHEDHTGALPYVLKELNVPVFAPRLAHGLITVKLKEHRILKDIQLHVVEAGKPLRLGKFCAEFFRVCHSIPDSMGIALRTPVGLVVHTGDFKIDHTPVDGKKTELAAIAQYNQEGVLLLLSDSTYADLPGYTPSEQVISHAMNQAIGNAPGRVLVATFASLISRVQQVINAAAKHERKIVIVGRSMVNNVKMATQMGYLQIPDGMQISIPEMHQIPLDKLVIITTGSQGEPTSALVRIANGTHKDIQIIPKDTVVVSATPIPGNETVVNRTIDDLSRQGAVVLYQRVSLVHVHGHASQEELKMMINLTQPRFFVPIHGDYRLMLAHANLAKSLGIPDENVFVLEDGDVLELTANGGEVTGRVPAGHVYVEGLHLRNMHTSVLRERKTLSQSGIVVVVVTLHKNTGQLVRAPEMVSMGFVDITESPHLLKEGIDTVRQTLEQDHRDPPERTFINSQVKDALGNFFYRKTGRRPTIVPVVIET